MSIAQWKDIAAQLRQVLTRMIDVWSNRRNLPKNQMNRELLKHSSAQLKQSLAKTIGFEDSRRNPSVNEMYIEVLKAAATQLRQTLQLRASTNSLASNMLMGLKPLLDSAIAGQITMPYQGFIPYSYPFSNGDMRDTPDVDSAYEHFMSALRGRSALYQ